MQESLIEKYSPKTIDELVIPSRIKTILKNNGLTQNYLFYSSSPGTGKTSAARLLTSNYSTLFKNSSLDTSVDVIRDEIQKWCQGYSLTEEGTHKKKAVILDEVDGVSDQFFKAMRGVTQQFEGISHFVATCNHITKIPDAIQSRFVCINFACENSQEEKEVSLQIAKRVWEILRDLEMTIQKDALLELVRRNFPDMRRIIVKIQNLYGSGIKEVTMEHVTRTTSEFKEIFELCINGGDAYKNYKLLMSKYGNKVDDVLVSLGVEFIEYIKEEKPDKCDKIPMLIIEVASHQAQRNHVIDTAITMLSLVYRCQMILNT